jgi:hypothetical protein
MSEPNSYGETGIDKFSRWWSEEGGEETVQGWCIGIEGLFVDILFIYMIIRIILGK